MSTSGKMRPLISFDYFFKIMLRDKSNFDILEGFLSTLLERDIRVEEILESETNRLKENSRQMVFDLVCKTDTGQIVLIELQFSWRTDFFVRMVTGTSLLIAERTQRGERELSGVEVISIHLVYFALSDGEEYVYVGSTDFRGLNTGVKLPLPRVMQSRYGVNSPSDLFPKYYVIDVRNYDNRIRRPLDEWIYYFRNNELPLKYSAKDLPLVSEKLKVSKMSPRDLELYEKYLTQSQIDEDLLNVAYQEGEARGIRKGLLEGIEKGLEKGKEEVVINSYLDGLDITRIAKIVNLSVDKVRAILIDHGLMNNGDR